MIEPVNSGVGLSGIGWSGICSGISILACDPAVRSLSSICEELTNVTAPPQYSTWPVYLFKTDLGAVYASGNHFRLPASAYLFDAED
jgi:hypothetical protein